MDSIVKKRQELNKQQVQTTQDDTADKAIDRRIDSLNKTNVELTKELAKVIVESKTEEVEVKELKDVVKAVDKVRDYLTKHPDDDSAVIEAINNLTKEVQKLPKEYQQIEFPEPVKEVTVKNMPDYSKNIQEVSKKIDNLKLDPKIKVEAPKVEVKPSQVDLKPLQDSLEALKQTIIENRVVVPPTDLSMLEGTMSDVNDAIRGLVFPVPNFIQDPLIRYKIADTDDDGTDSTPNYFGYIDPEGKWYIMKEDKSTNPSTYRYAYGGGNGSTNNQYPTKWANRASLIYDYFNVVFP